MAAKPRAINVWLVSQWLEGYPHGNVAVFDYHNVLSSKGGNPRRKDHPTATWHRKDTGELVPLLNIFVRCGQGDGGCPL